MLLYLIIANIEKIFIFLSIYVLHYLHDVYDIFYQKLHKLAHRSVIFSLRLKFQEIVIRAPENGDDGPMGFKKNPNRLGGKDISKNPPAQCRKQFIMI